MGHRSNAGHRGSRMSGGGTSVRRTGFFGVPEIRRVEDEIRKLKDRAGD